MTGSDKMWGVVGTEAETAGSWRGRTFICSLIDSFIY